MRLALALLTTLVARPALGEISVPACDWPIQIAVSAGNVFYPDSIASYWVMPFKVQDGLRVVISGTFPDARYASFNVYTDAPSFGSPFVANGVGSSLADYRIAADPGSGNPWQASAPGGGAFTVTLRQDVAPGDANTLPLAPEGSVAGRAGWVIYRVYLPAGGANGDDYYDFDRIALPRVRFEIGGETRDVAACRTTPAVIDPPDPALVARLTSTNPAPAALAVPAGTPSSLPGEHWFFRPPNEESVGGFPNADSAYVGAVAVVPPPERDVVVIRAKAPRHPPGLRPSPWPAPGALDVRYWSMCTYTFTSLDENGQPQLTFPLVVNDLPDGTRSYGCRHDDITALDADGFYTYVIGTESQRARIERVPGVTFLPFSLRQPRAPHSIYFRNMVPADDYRQGCQYVPYDRNPAAAEAVMGDYYPRSSVCSLATLVRDGAGACLTRRSAACAFTASDAVVLGARTVGTGADVFAQGRVEVGGRVDLDAGTLVAAPRVMLGTRASVFDVDTTTLERGTKAIVGGEVGSAPPPATACTVPTLSCAGDDVIVERGVPSPVLAAGTHGTLRMATRTRVTLAPGRHVFCGIETGRGVVIEASGPGQTTIDVAGNLSLGKRSRLGAATGAPAPRMRVAGAEVRIGTRAIVEASVTAPAAAIEVERAALMTGGACGRTLTTGRRVVLGCAP